LPPAAIDVFVELELGPFEEGLFRSLLFASRAACGKNQDAEK
jgi:hypothetical protein